jgi:hypothetical protein
MRLIVIVVMSVELRQQMRDGRHGARVSAAPPLAGLSAEVATRLAIPAGAGWLHQRVVVMHLIITLRVGTGVRLVCVFLELSGWSAVVGASSSSQYALTLVAA